MSNDKFKCIVTNKCRRCPQQNDNPTSFICRRCTRQQRMYQRRRLVRMRRHAPSAYRRVQEQWRVAQRALRRRALP